MGLDAFLQEYGYSEKQLPAIAGSYSGRGLIVCGDAACLWHDLEAFGARCDRGRGSAMKSGWDFMAVNRVVETFCGNIEHAYSNQPAILDRFIAARRDEYRKEFTGPRHTHSHADGAKWRWPLGGHGTSGLGACLVGIGLGYEQIVLAGMPLDDGPHNGEPHWRKTTFTREAPEPVGGGVSRHWQRARDLAFDGKVRSLSGRTRDWLGHP